MAFYSELTVNITKTKAKLVTSPQIPTPLEDFPAWFLGEVREIKVCFVRQKVIGAAEVSVVSAIGSSLHVKVGDPGSDAITSATAGPAVNDIYTVILPLNVPAVSDFLGQLPTRTTVLEFELTSSTTFHRYQVYITICCPIGESPLVEPAPPDSALGRVEAMALFVPIVGLPGGSFILTSEDGGQTRIYRGNDGEVHFDNVIP